MLKYSVKTQTFCLKKCHEVDVLVNVRIISTKNTKTKKPVWSRSIFSYTLCDKRPKRLQRPTLTQERRGLKAAKTTTRIKKKWTCFYNVTETKRYCYMTRAAKGFFFFFFSYPCVVDRDVENDDDDDDRRKKGEREILCTDGEIWNLFLFFLFFKTFARSVGRSGGRDCTGRDAYWITTEWKEPSQVEGFSSSVLLLSHRVRKTVSQLFFFFFSLPFIFIIAKGSGRTHSLCIHSASAHAFNELFSLLFPALEYI